MKIGTMGQLPSGSSRLSGTIEAVIDLPAFGHRPIDALVEAALDEIARECQVARHAVIRDAEIARLRLDRAGEFVEHADAEGGHVVDEELVDVLGRDDQRHVGRGLGERGGETAIAGVEGGDLARLAEIAGIDDVRQMRRREAEAKLRHDPSPLGGDGGGKALRRLAVQHVVAIDEIG